MFEITDEDGFTKIVVQGKLTHDDYVNTLIPEIDKIAKAGNMKIMNVMEDFSGIEFKALIDDLKTAFKHRKDFKKVAVVTNQVWMKIGLNIFKNIVDGEVQIFKAKSDTEAWLQK